jgi:hypothetical protein
MHLAGHEDYKEICEDARLEDRAHWELIVTISHLRQQPGKNVPIIVQQVALRQIQRGPRTFLQMGEVNGTIPDSKLYALNVAGNFRTGALPGSRAPFHRYDLCLL